MRKISLLISMSLLTVFVFAQQQMTQRANLTYTSDLSDIWGWTDTNGDEYALVTTKTGLSVVDMSDPDNPYEVDFVSGNFSTWRDVKTWSHYAYVVTEGGGGMQIVDLSNVPTSVSFSTWTGGMANYSRSHNIYIDENGYGYICGARNSSNQYIANGGVIILDLNSNPSNPSIVGQYDIQYVHDCYVRGDTLWTAEVYNGTVGVVDVSNKASVSLMANFNTPGNFAHNVWLSNDGHTLFTTDEISSGVVAAYDVSELSNIQFLDSYQSSPGSGVIPHNALVQDNFTIVSYYADGVKIIDHTVPDILIETEYYDTAPSYTGSTFDGCWGVYAGFSSGLIIASDQNTGLHILDPAYIRASYLKGTVTDYFTGQKIPNVQVDILGTSLSENTNIIGEYKTGSLDSGSFQVRFIKANYDTLYKSVVLSPGVIQVLDAQLIHEDSTVNNQVCGTPQNPVTDILKPGKVELSWDTIGTAISYIINGRRQGFSNWVQSTLSPGTNNSKVYKNLGNKDYEWRVRAICQFSDTSWSDWTSIQQFSLYCPDVSNVWTDQIGTNSARLNWSSLPEAEAYLIQGRLTGTSAKVEFNTTDTFRVVSGLDPGTSYEWRVAAACDAGAGLLGDFTVWNNFTTNNSANTSRNDLSLESNWEIVDLSGKILYHGTGNSELQTIQLSLPSGIYILGESTGIHGFETQSLIIIND